MPASMIKYGRIHFELCSVFSSCCGLITGFEGQGPPTQIFLSPVNRLISAFQYTALENTSE